MLKTSYKFILYILGIIVAIQLTVLAAKMISERVVKIKCSGQCIREPHDKNYH